MIERYGDRTGLVNTSTTLGHPESGWYGCCRTALGWFLTAAGIQTEEERNELITHAIGGRFSSWVEPSQVDVQSVAERLAEQVVRVGT